MAVYSSITAYGQRSTTRVPDWLESLPNVIGNK